MTVLKCLAAAAGLGLSAQIAIACDDYAEEMILAAAQEAARTAQSQAGQVTSPAPTDIASVQEPSAQAEAPGAVQR